MNEATPIFTKPPADLGKIRPAKVLMLCFGKCNELEPRKSTHHNLIGLHIEGHAEIFQCGDCGHIRLLAKAPPPDVRATKPGAFE